MPAFPSFDRARYRTATRAFCHERGAFRDFLLPRISGIRDEDAPGLLSDEDGAWQEVYRIRLKPHPALSDAQKQAIAADYGMRDGVFEIPMRLAMLFYFRKQYLGLDYREHERSPQQQHVVMADPESVRAAQARADAPPRTQWAPPR